ncbi:MAG TPA: hypothetical protein VK525_11625 [Candidatus Saccharimonadales bacterium]|nr:hypothetical protein [Candidatus Saccharimonadales bacterium]
MPLVEPVGTIAVIWDAVFTVNVVAAVPLNFTELAPVKLAPPSVTLTPMTPLVGVKLVIVGTAAETEKLAADVAVPPGVVAVILPVVAPGGTPAVIFVLLFTVNVAVVPLNFTALAPVKFVPVTATLVPVVPVVGVKLVMVGAAGVTVKALGEAALPPGVVTRIEPVVAPAGTLVAIWVALCTVKVAGVPLKESADAPARFVPVMATLVPVAPLVGVKLEIVGAAALTVKFPDEVTVPPGAVNEIFPVVAPEGTAAVICVALLTVNVAAVPLKETVVAPARLVPVIVTLAPTTPLVGAKLVIVGAAAVTVKVPAELVAPLGVVSEIFPVVAPAGTVAVICVALLTTKVEEVPLNVSEVVPAKFVPVTTTLVPAVPDCGAKELIVGPAAGGLVVVPGLFTLAQEAAPNVVTTDKIIKRRRRTRLGAAVQLTWRSSLKFLGH